MTKIIILTLIIITVICFFMFFKSQSFNIGIRQIDYNGDKQISAAEAKDDIASLIYAVTTGHPNVYFLHDKQDFLNFIENEVYPYIKSSNTADDLIPLAAKLLFYVGDDHTSIYPYGRDKYAPPFSVGKKNNAFYITDSDHESLVDGIEIFSINEINIEDIWNALCEFVDNPYGRCLDGNITKSFKNAMSLAFKYTNFMIKTKDDDGNLISNLVEAKTTENYLSNKDSIVGMKINQKPVKLEQFSDIAIVTIFHLAMSPEYKSVFSGLNKNNTKKLVLDIRGSPGGSPYAVAEILNYLTGVKAVSIVSPRNGLILKKSYVARVSLENNVPLLLRPGLLLKKTYRDVLMHSENDPSELISLEENLHNFYTDKFSLSRKLNLDKFIVLVDSQTKSAASILAGMLQKYANAVVIGEETHGSAWKNFGWTSNVYLPNTDIAVQFSSAYMDRTGETNFPHSISWPDKEEQGVMPDIKIISISTDPNDKTDYVMEAAIKYLTNENQKP